MPVVTLPDGWALAVDIAAWGLCHAATGYAAHRLEPHHLARDRGLLRQPAAETPDRYRRWLSIERWKDALPEAGALFAGGISKRALPAGAQRRARLELFMRETRRAELAHWWAMACSPLFILWNRQPAAAILVAYGVLVNLPFIAIQRYNRARIRAILDRPAP